MEGSQKIVISSHADQRLESMLKMVNEDFQSGRVKKAELTSWIICEFETKHFSKSIDKIREDHFDEVAHLKSILKQVELAKKSDQEIDVDRLLGSLKNRLPKQRQARQPDAEKVDTDLNIERGNDVKK